MKLFTKEGLVERLKQVRGMGWIPNARPGNAGGVGNTLEDLLGITENNLPIPNAAEWELKCQRQGQKSLTTLFHMEPSPRGCKIVPSLLLPKYGWLHQTIPGEMSFRQTISGLAPSDRGFIVKVDREAGKVLISFDPAAVAQDHREWLISVRERAGLAEMSPQPYWGFDDLHHKAATKLLNCFYIQAKVKREQGAEYFLYEKIMILRQFTFPSMLSGIEQGFLYVDFDARTHHNHGTKFRLRQGALLSLYGSVEEVS